LNAGGTISVADAVGTSWDVLVVGAGPAGALASRRAALDGMRVLLVDRQRFPRDKVCGGCLSARTVAALRAAGVGGSITNLGGRRLNRLRLGGWGRAARLRLPPGLALSRRSLDAALVDQAVEAGAEFLPGHCVAVGACESDRRRVSLRSASTSRETAAKVVVDASGLGSGFLDPEANERVPAGARVGCSTVVDGSTLAYVEGTIYMAVDAVGYLGAVRLEDGRLNIAAALDPDAVRIGGPGSVARSILRGAGFDALDELQRARWSGTPRLGQRPRRRAAERVFAIGDAAGYVEPFTGEGIGWAVQSATMLGPIVEQAVVRWSDELMATWTRTHRLELARSQRACRVLAWLLRRPRAVRTAIRALERRPELGAPVVRHLHAARGEDERLAWL
jgi:flavin-dependent dehydrogenase